MLYFIYYTNMLGYCKNTVPVPKQTCLLFMKCTNESSSPLITSHCGNTAHSVWIYLPWRHGTLQLFSAWFKQKNKWKAIKRLVCQRKGLRNSWIPRQWICLVALFAFPGNSRGKKVRVPVMMECSYKYRHKMRRLISVGLHIHSFSKNSLGGGPGRIVSTDFSLD